MYKRQAVARLGYGGSATVNGCDAVNATAVLNAMIGSNQMIGGNANYGNAPVTSGNGARYKLSEVPGKPKVSASNAAYISRTKKAFKDTDEYKRRVAAGEKDPQPLLPWFSAATSADNQALVSVINQYPYQAKIMLAWETSPTPVSYTHLDVYKRQW